MTVKVTQPNAKIAPMRCTYEWSIVVYAGAPSVQRFVRCRWLHRGINGRWDRRVSNR